MAEKRSGGGGIGGVLEQLPTDELMGQTRDLMSAMGERVLSVTTEKIEGLTGRLLGVVENGGRTGSDDGGSAGSPVKRLLSAGVGIAKDKVMDKIGGGGGGPGGSGKSKTTDILEQIEVGVPVRVAYNVWTQFQDFPKFTKRVETVEQKSDEKVTWKAAIYFSHRSWESTIIEQVPDEHIVWRSQGDKGYVDGTVTFHEITPDLTRILVVLEYHPQGLFERTGNAFRSQRRRARLELHQFARHVMRHTILEQDEVEGWRGEIRDGEVVRSHEDALEDEEAPEDEDGEEPQDEDQDQDEDEYDDEYEDEYEDEDEDERDDEPEEEPEDESDDEPAEEDEDEDEHVNRRPSRRRSRESSRSR